MNIWGKIGLTVLALAGGSKLFAATKAFQVSEELHIDLLNPRIHKLDPNPFGGGIEVRTEVQLQNPTNGRLQITQPYLQILSHGKVMSATNVNGKQFTLKPLSQLKLDTVSFKLEWATILTQLAAMDYGIPVEYSLIKKIGWLITNYKQIVSKLDLAVRYSLYANGLFFSDTQKINA